MILNKEEVAKAREVIELKRAYWEKKLGVKFDKDGRVSMGGLPTFDETDCYEYVESNISKKFSACFLLGLDELKLERFELESLTYDDYKRKRVTVTTTKGRTKEVSLASLLQKAQNVWEKKYGIYRPYRNHMKQIRAEDGGMEMDKLNAILRKMELGNTYIAYDRLLREFQEQELIISINPLDKLFAAGGPGGRYGRNAITKFSSCWSNRVDKLNDEEYEIRAEGSYANPKGQIIIGSHIGAGMVIIKNGNEFEVDGMKLYGMLQRSHIWLSDLGLFVENIYPDKYNQKRIDEVNSILSAKVKVIEPSNWIKLEYSSVSFDKDKWYEQYLNSVNRNGKLYLDRSGIDNASGDVWINPRFRYHNHGGTCWLPSEVRG